MADGWIIKCLDVACFFEAEIGFGLVEGGRAEDEVVEQLDLKEFRCFDEFHGGGVIGGAGVWIAGGVVVDDDDSCGVVFDGGAEDIARVEDGFVEGAAANFCGGDEVELGVEGKDAEAFVGELAHFVGKEAHDAFGVIHGEGVAYALGEACGELECGLELYGFGHADASDAAELLHGGAAKGIE